MNLESLTPGTEINGILPSETVTIVAVTWIGENAVEVFYKDQTGQVGSQLLHRKDEQRLEVDG